MPIRFCRYCGRPIKGQKLYSLTCGSKECHNEYLFEYRVLRRTDGPPKLPVPKNKGWTTLEEKRLLSLVKVEGYTIEAAARELGRTPKSVQRHIQELRRKGHQEWDDIPKQPNTPKSHTKISRDEFLRRLYEFEQEVLGGQVREPLTSAG